MGPLSLVTPVTLSKEPVAWEMKPVGTWGATSLPLPTTSGRGPRRGGCGYFGVGVQGTSTQSDFG